MKIAIINGKIIDGKGSQPRRGTILVDGSTIYDILSSDAVLPKVDQKIDAGDGTILPGLIDVHDHQTYHNTIGTLYSQWRLSRDQLIIRSFVAACDAFRHGITFIRDMGAVGATNLSMRDAVNRGEIVGPRIITCGTPLVAPGGHAYEICTEASGADSIRSAVRYQLKNGVDFIKLMVSHEQPMPYQKEQTVPWYTLDEIKVAVEVAHDAGVKVSVHACGTKAIERCLDAGVDDINHGVYTNRELAQRMREQGVYYTPTLGAYLANTDPYWHRGKAKTDFCKLLLEEHQKSFKCALEAGVKLTIGTDAITPMASEMKLLIDAGADPMMVLCTATRINAELIGRQQELGTIEKSKTADILIVGGNPLEEISNLLNVKIIIQGGKVFYPDQLLPMLPAYKEAYQEERWI